MILVSEVAIVSTYVQLCHEDYHWWWRSYFVGTSPAFYLFQIALLVRLVYPLMNRDSNTTLDPSLELESKHNLQGGLQDLTAYALTSMLAAITVGLMSGSAAVLSSFKFNRVIYD
jgi:transmembrane 9 superfamily protein 2/4